MDEEFIQKLIVIGLLLLMFGTWLTYNKISNIELPESQCSEVVDIIYEQCSEEGHINLTTLEGRSKTLEYTNGVCVIK